MPSLLGRGGWGVSPTMKKKEKLVYKIKRLLRRLGMPRWLHHYGPKKYELLHHLTALLVKHYCRLSYRRVKRFLDLLGLLCPTKSSLQRTAAKLDSMFWNQVLKATTPNPYLIALDSTGFSKSNPSYHYLKRIDGKMPKIPIKLNVAYDTRRKKFCSAKARVLPAHDIKDAEFLIKNNKSKIVVADKGYNSEKLYEKAFYQETLLMIPKKKNMKRGFFRRKMHKKFNLRTYHRRELVEAGFSSIKRTQGSSVSSKKARTIRSELLGRLACQNIFSLLFRTFGTEPLFLT